MAQQLGYQAIGYEPHPFFVRIARAKTSPPPAATHLDRLERVLRRGLQRLRPTRELSEAAATFLSKLFHARTLQQLMGARDALASAGLDGDDIAFLVLSRVLDMCSTAQTDGIYKAPTTTKQPAAPGDAIRFVLDQLRADALVTQAPARSPIIHSTTAEDMSATRSRSVDIAVTSPPYLNNFDFAEMTRMYLYFWGVCASWREITQTVRAKLVVNTTTALGGQRELQEQHRARIPDSLLPALDPLVQALRRQRSERAGKKEYDLLVYPYFAQMRQILSESLRCLRTRGEFHLVVADAAFYGIHVSTPQLLATLMSELGYADVRCTQLRERGHRWILQKRDGSPLGLGEYHITAERR